MSYTMTVKAVILIMLVLVSVVALVKTAKLLQRARRDDGIPLVPFMEDCFYGQRGCIQFCAGCGFRSGFCSEVFSCHCVR
ncbi:hypothetical protein BIW11_07616 [Tropilaelaps mercedesae]|uniref:Uncharacterized protein n=1 Tax=Tropilaelaps mercedesae TaxID=418985 RepID=A0A1V9XT82_9ACAR|nr:hypothetical protein BIW11_07616 [Tropilaelaps mercedesae]